MCIAKDGSAGEAQALAACAASCVDALAPTLALHLPPQKGNAFLGLVLDLLRRGMLPAIAFSFERLMCHFLAQRITLYLEVRSRAELLCVCVRALSIHVSPPAASRCHLAPPCAHAVLSCRPHCPPARPQECEAQDRLVNAHEYRVLRKAAQAAEKQARAMRDKKPDKRQGGEEVHEGAAGAGYDMDAVLPEYTLAGGHGWLVDVGSWHIYLATGSVQLRGLGPEGRPSTSNRRPPAPAPAQASPSSWVTLRWQG